VNSPITLWELPLPVKLLIECASRNARVEINVLHRLLPLSVLTLSLALVGCTPARQLWNASEEFWAPAERPPWFDEMQKQPLEQVIRGPRAWWQYEVGRRYETGAQELPRDLRCAAYWFHEAASSDYEFINYGGPGRPYLETARSTLPWGRIGIRRLRAQGVELEPSTDYRELRRACSPDKYVTKRQSVQ
jgi:hypothetical protein